MKLKLTIISLALFFAPSIALGATEFISIIDPDNGAGTDFSSLSAWESTIESDLTAATSQVFSGTRTGTMTNTTTVYLCRGGAYQTHYGTLTHASSTQAYIIGITGSATEASGDIWYTNNTCNSATYFTISDGGDSAIAVASCRSSSGTADTTAVHITGWTTSETNYIKIWTDPSLGNRHGGKWDSSKYNITVANNAGFRISEEFVHIEGIQVHITAATTFDDSAIWINAPAAGWKIYISECILRGAGSATYWHAGVQTYAATAGTAYVSNCVAYDFKSSVLGAGYLIAANGAGGDGSTMYVYNSTAYNCGIGYRRYATGINLHLKNDIAQNCTDGFMGTFDANSNYNISDLSNDAPGANSKNSTTVNFVSTVSGVEDFHLASTDMAARDSGIDLSADANLPFSTDIDGDTRPINSTWDIGADEAPTPIYRSVGPSATSALDSNSSPDTNTITISSGAATFAEALADNVGVGDVILYDSNDDNSLTSADSIAFIKSRTDSTHYALQTHTGATPSNLSANDTWAIYRAHTSLANAEAGTINSTLSGLGFSFNGGNRDLVTNNEQWNIAAYANGTTADSTAVTIDGWVTGAQNYIKIYTPVSASEVGTSQRHSGKLDNGKYKLQVTNSTGLRIADSHVRVDGLQINVISSNVNYNNGIRVGDEFSNDIRISNNIINGNIGGTSNYSYGIWLNWASTNSGRYAYIWNNIITNWRNGAYVEQTGIRVNSNWTKTYLYNNTIYNSYSGIYGGGGGVGLLKNNITQNCDDGYNPVSAFDSSSDYNISDISGDAPNASFTGGYATIPFLDAANGDFHLATPNNPAINAGADLSSDPYLSFSTDIDGESRPVDASWDIGADEYSAHTKAKFQGTIKFNGNINVK